MRVPRIYLDAPLEQGSLVSLPDSQAHHVRNVLKRRTGDEIILLNGKGGECDARIDALSRHVVQVRVGELRYRNPESPLQLHLGQGIAKGERMDFVIQKAVELGVSSITPLITQRTVVRIDQKRMEKKQLHWQKVADSALEQSGRTIRVMINVPLALHSWLKNVIQENMQAIILHADAPKSLSSLKLDRDKPIALLLGPEGGLGPEERKEAVAAGSLLARMGPRILRTETATLVALSIIQANWGDLRED